MDKAIERYLARRGIHATMPAEGWRTFSERAPRFFEWFHGSVLGLDTEEYRRAFWREAYRTGRTIGHVPRTLEGYLRRRGAAYRQDMANLLAYALLMGGSFAVWVMRRQIDRHIRRLKRPGYYERELARRHELARERRRLLKRSTLNPCPTDVELREAFARAKGSPADMIRFGSLLEDLECHVDSSAIFNEEGSLVGRRGGIRRYLALNVPELSARYKTVMRYKALAKRFRQALGVQDPVPAAMLLPEPETKGNPAVPADPGKREFASEKYQKGLMGKSQKAKGQMDGQGQPSSQAESERNPGKTDGREFASAGNLKGMENEVLVAAREDVLRRDVRSDVLRREGVLREDVLREARKEAERLLAGCEGSCVSLMAALAIRISPDYAPQDEGGMRKAADRMADAKSWIVEERKRITRARARMAKLKTG